MNFFFYLIIRRSSVGFWEIIIFKIYFLIVFIYDFKYTEEFFRDIPEKFSYLDPEYFRKYGTKAKVEPKVNHYI